MAAPTYSAGTIGNVLASGTSLAHGANIAVLIDLSTKVGGAIGISMSTGGTPPTAATTFALHRVQGATAAGNTTLSAAVTGPASTIDVVSGTGIIAGQSLALISATTGIGEVVTTSSISGTTVTLTGNTENSYASGDKVFLIEQTASGGSSAPGSGWVLNNTYGTTLYPPAAWVWILHAINTDTAEAVSVCATLDTNPTIA